MQKPVIDWGWVRRELFDKERIGKVRDRQQKQFIGACADECLFIAKTLAKPAAHSVRKPLSCLARSKQLGLHLKGSIHTEIFVATIGGNLEKEASRRMRDGDALRGYFLDRIGSFAAESLAESAENTLRAKYAASGKSVSARYSPGYCGFPIDQQRRLSRLAGFSKAGVRLSKNCMMIPVKSVSAVVGIGPKGLFRKTKTPCVKCGKKDCSYRR